MARCFGFVVCLALLILDRHTARGGETDWPAKLRAFANKVDKTKGSATTPKAALEPRLTELPPGDLKQAATQIRSLSVAIKNGDPERVDQGFDRITAVLPGALQQEWRAIINSLRADLKAPREKASASWRMQIDQLADDTRDICLKAEKASELEGILVRCTLLEKEPLATESEVTERARRKLRSIANVANHWMDYLEQKAAGFNEYGAQLLGYLLNEHDDFPILSRQEISTVLMHESSTLKIEEATRRVYESIKGPANLRSAADRAEELRTQPGLSGLAKDVKTLEYLRGMWDLMQKDGPEAFRRLANRESATSEGAVYLGKWEHEILIRAVRGAVVARLGWKVNPAETEIALLIRAVDQLFANGDLENASRLMTFAMRALDAESASAFDSRAVDKFLAATRFESAGDLVAAVECYRDILISSARYSPNAQATAALARLHETHAAILDDPNGALVQQVRALNDLLRRPRPKR